MTSSDRSIALPAPRAVREYGAVDRRMFEDEIRPARRPAVLRGVGRDWPAVRAAIDGPVAVIACLKRFSHDRPVPAVVGAPAIRGRFFYTDDLQGLNFTRGKTALAPFLDRLLRDRDAPEPYAMAVQSIPAPELVPGFIADNHADLAPPGTVPRLWLGNAIRVAAHYDLMENIGVVIAGRRRFTVFPPDQLANLYMGPIELTPAGTPVSLVDIQAPDLDRFPRFAEAWAHAEQVVLEPGDAIYLPYHWWHAVDSLDPVNLFMNYWWDPAPKGIGNPYEVLLHALSSLRALPDDQRAVWRTIFDHLVFQVNGDPAAHLPPEVQGVLGPPDATSYARVKATLAQQFGGLG
jgi:hypothetical protein